jgi:hypothetical protein
MNRSEKNDLLSPALSSFAEEREKPVGVMVYTRIRNWRWNCL